MTPTARFCTPLLVLMWLLTAFGEALAQSPTPPPHQYKVHFKPADHALGDVHPYFHQGECYLYYLKPKTYDAALVHSRDLLHWTQPALVHTGASPEDWFSPYFVLGVFRDERAGVFRSFYGHREGRMPSSISPDLLTWSCAPRDFSIPPSPSGEYVRRRDPYVFWIPERKLWGCVMTTLMKGRPKEKAGAVSYATSPDLTHWTQHGPILDPGDIGEPECPQIFRLGNHWYLLASIYDRAVGQPVYWRADAPEGPWKGPPLGVLDGKDLCAAQVAIDGETPVLTGWIPLNASRPGGQHWGGHLALPRTLHARQDGRLDCRLHPSVAKRIRPKPTFVHDAAHPSTTPAKTAELALPGTWETLHLEAELEWPAEEGWLEVAFNTSTHLAGMVRLDGPKRLLTIMDGNREVWASLPVDPFVRGRFSLLVIVDHDIVEVFLQDRYSLAAKLPAPLRGAVARLAGAASLRIARVQAGSLDLYPVSTR